MSLSFRSSRMIAIIGLAGVAAAASTTQASAFGGFGVHFGGFGGVHGHFGGFGGPRFFGPRFGGFGPRVLVGGGFGPFQRPFRHFGPRHVVCFTFPCNVPQPLPCRFTHTCGPIGPVGPVICRFGRCFPVGPVIPQPIYYPRPYYPAPVQYPVAQTYRAPAYSAPAPAAYSAQAPAAIQQPTTLSVLFKPTATSADITNFVKAYNVAVSSGPDANGVYRLQISAGPVPQDQLNQIVESMRTQTNVVSQVGA